MNKSRTAQRENVNESIGMVRTIRVCNIKKGEQSYPLEFLHDSVRWVLTVDTLVWVLVLRVDVQHTCGTASELE